MTVMSEYMESGILGFDKILLGGLPRNHMYAIYGSSGSGKTTLSLQFLLKGAEMGERCLYIGTSESGDEIRQIAHSHGWSLEGINITRLLYHTEKTGTGQTMLYPAEVELPQIVDRLIKLIEGHNPQRVVFDSLSEIRLLAGQMSWYQNQLLLLKTFLESRDCTAIFTDIILEPSSPLRTIVHGEIELSRIEPNYGPERRRIRIDKLRGHSFVSGFHDYTIVRGGLKVFPRLISSEHRRHFTHELISSGNSEIDHLLHGGLERGTVTLVQGVTGTGKTSLATQYAVTAAQRNEHSLIFCFDERISTFVERAKGLGMDLETYIADSRITISQIDPAELTAGEFSNMVYEAVIQYEVLLVIIDSINGYAYALPDERFLSVHLHELTSFLDLQGVVTLLTLNQQGGLGFTTAPSPFDISYISDSVINLAFFEHRGQIHKSLMVLKQRSGYHESTIRELTMDSKGLHIGPVLYEFEGIATGIPRYVSEKT
ncbi:MAG TPA: ATPase domain-containing protein [Chitinispirillaceae bacterium]|nr:ATPase domain-containing protein [Chitinispirillaceae bacterium]